SAPKCRKVHCPCIEGRVTFNPASPLNEVQQTSGHPLGRMGSGYGSECHLLRFLGRHRKLLNQTVADVVGAEEVDWLDYPFDPEDEWRDGEWKGLAFLREDAVVQQAWRDAWPARGNPPNWDAVGRVRIGSAWEWLLVEAKANLEELSSSCQAKKEGGRSLIESTLSMSKQKLGVDADRDWLNGFYQYCNRVAVLSFLQDQGIPARLLFVYFTGDRSGPGRTCPQDVEGWAPVLRAQTEHVGLPVVHPLKDRIHRTFVPVVPLLRE
ncbi:hypothetical protein VSX64_24215, partial [Aurantimonas sp. C2-6-R+9]|nr:hypothetical protein [Aurantimonas sp. C2-6-R+9]